MPFTISHTAACLPFLNRTKAVGWRAALVFGTMAPDLMFPIPYFGERGHTHSIKGLFALDVPFAVFLAAVWIFVLSKRVARLPGLASIGLHDASAFSIPMALLGALVGGASHLCWDMFTHHGSPLLEHPFFYRVLFEGHDGAVLVQTVIWYLNSLVGLAIVAWWVRSRLHAGGDGFRGVFLSGPWLRIFAAFSLPYGLILLKLLHGRPDKLAQAVIDLVYMVDLVRMGMLVSFVFAMAMVWWETRSRVSVAPPLGSWE